MPVDLHVNVFCCLNMSNRSRLSAGGFDATLLKKQSQSLRCFGHKAALHKKLRKQYLSLSVITRANLMQVLAIAVCIMKEKKEDRA